MVETATGYACTTCGDVGRLTPWGARLTEDDLPLAQSGQIPTIACPDCPELEVGIRPATPAMFLAQVTHGYDAEEVLARVDRAWVLLDDRFPIPAFMPACPSCRGDDVQLSRIVYGKHEGTIPARADVQMKCCVCSMSWIHGVALSDETYRRATRGDRYAWGWREIKEEADGVGDR